MAVGKITRARSFSYVLGFRLGVYAKFGLAECLPKFVGLAVDMGAVCDLDFCPVFSRFCYVGVISVITDFCPVAVPDLSRSVGAEIGGGLA